MPFFMVMAAGGRARADASTILVLSSALGTEDARLVEALRIYTGDVDRRLVLGGPAPRTCGLAVVRQLVEDARHESADIVLWSSRLADGRSAYCAFDVDARDLRQTEIAPLGAERAAEDVALKVRSLLSRRQARAAEDAPAVASPKPKPVTAPAPPPTVRPPEPTGAGAPPAIVARPAAEPVPAHRFGLAVAYNVVVPSDSNWLRHGILVAVEARLGRSAATPVSLVLDAKITTQPTAMVRGYAVTISDVPVGLGLVLTRVGSFASLGAGPRASLHAFDVTINDGEDLMRGVRRYSLGLGGVARVDVPLAAYMKVFLSATIEALVPKQQFTIAAQPALDTGGMVSSAAIGLEWLLL
ncbi:MAG TPA: hypothetical protein VH374_10100 [Polyangia bacterium]|jgi:hypothetical protein|nr:hypothetical protein [Polyangia bacterium]